MKVEISKLLVALLVFIPTSLVAQDSSLVISNSFVRITAAQYMTKADSSQVQLHAEQEKQFIGKLLSSNAEMFTLDVDGYEETFIFNRRWVNKIEVRRGRRSGILFGMLVGFAIGRIYQMSTDLKPSSYYDFVNMLGGGFAGGLLSSIERWKEVRLEDFR